MFLNINLLINACDLTFKDQSYVILTRFVSFHIKLFIKLDIFA